MDDSRAARRAEAVRRVGKATGCGPRGCLGFIAIMAIGIVAVVGLDWVMRSILDPWSVPLGGRPTLTGEWVGTIRSASGARYGLAMRIDYHERTGGRGTSSGRGPTMEGLGQVCNRRGERYDYRLSGRTLDWGGSRSSIGLGSVDTSVSGSGWGFEARWDGHDRLTLVGEHAFEMIDERPTGGRSSLAELDPAVGDLQRGPPSGLDAVCRGLAEVR